MKKERLVDIRISPQKMNDQEQWKDQIALKLQITPSEIKDIIVRKRSIDARGRSPVYQLRVAILLQGEERVEGDPLFEYQPIKSGKKVIIVGAGPCGYFCALRCIELGLIPIVLDRGKDVQSRRRDLRNIQQIGLVNPDSNYCFGEGGAGTYSDGKLYTRSVKRGNVRKILQILVHHGANHDILIDAHPHIGSNKLPKIINAIRDTIESHGGQVHFGTRVVDFILNQKTIKGVRTKQGDEFFGDAIILCTGHSARDIYSLCDQRGVFLEFKPFAIGMRVEHPQPLIDKIQYNQNRGDFLPAASYSLSCQVDDHGIFSFCMCPGGLIVPASTAPGELVVNGMSLSRRDSAFANAAMVVTIDQNPEEDNPFGGMNFQKAIEQKGFSFGDGTQQAPAQRVTDFVKGRMSSDLPESSYIPGIYPGPLHEIMPDFIVKRLKKALKTFDQKMRGYYTREAQFVGIESRTSSPIRIPRDKDSLMSPDISGLFPAGEGAGYAGGILSAALDGERVADAVCAWVKA